MPTGAEGTKSLVITGGSRGIGLAIATRFQAQGFAVTNLSRHPSPLKGVCNIAADFSADSWADQVKEALSAQVAGASSISLVHNSALQVPGGVQMIEAQQLRAMLEINVVAPTILNQLLLEQMKPGSSILYIGSTLSLRATPYMAAYTTCKHALVGLMRATCQDLAGSRIHTACICPGFTNTEMLRSYGGEALERLASLSTQKRLIDPEEIADVVYFAAASPVVNGSVLAADLGFIEP